MATDRWHREGLIYMASCSAGRHEIVKELANCGGPPTDDEIYTMVENAYRRGFTQGAAACVRAVKAGKSDKVLETWSLDLMDWRCRKHRGKATPPKELV
jgi:hypothetical protein